MVNAFVPGRANLIGEHLDYNEGLALPFALQFGVSVSAAATDDEVVTVHSDGYGTWRSDEDDESEWTRLAHAVLDARGVRGVRLDVSSTLPVGAGLSSSAAYLGAIALAVGVEGGLFDVARFLQECERRAGHEVGLLDQLATLGSRRGHGLFIDFVTNELRDVAIPHDLAFTAVDSMIRRQLATTNYTQRRDECERARTLLGPWRNVTATDVATVSDPVLRRRARHVVSEYQRVMSMVDALASGDLVGAGELVSESHLSLSQDFEVSTAEIDELVTFLRAHDGVYGARLVGGGFGGCILVAHEPELTRPFDTLTHWSLEVASGAFERLGRSRNVTV